MQLFGRVTNKYLEVDVVDVMTWLHVCFAALLLG